MFKKKPITLFRHEGLYLALVHPKGRGVFCAEDIAKDTVIELSPLLIFDEEEALTVDDTLLKNYVFDTSKMPPAVYKRAYINDPTKASALVMGVSSFCNSRHDPNAKLDLVDGHHSAYYKLTAFKDIPKETEICVNYGLTWFTSRKYQITKSKDAPKKEDKSTKD